ncbi:Uu.00g100190.m01.CDS01 [Anthostomella pinea]|uniref:Uu.00g100190.m01.CDS01 n=1 Tax=Anthostomella pinea TaxID=933095 RepID=A0AAI8VCY8_9PEZI|nr:Uu.00g100190.m01.CDS01 [Anthostomella pinea]
MLTNTSRIALAALATAIPALGATIDLQARQPNQMVAAIWSAPDADIDIAVTKVASNFAIITWDGKVVYDGTADGIKCDGKTYTISGGCFGSSRSFSCDMGDKNPKTCKSDSEGLSNVGQPETDITGGAKITSFACTTSIILERSENCEPDSTGFKVEVGE